VHPGVLTQHECAPGRPSASFAMVAWPFDAVGSDVFCCLRYSTRMLVAAIEAPAQLGPYAGVTSVSMLFASCSAVTSPPSSTWRTGFHTTILCPRGSLGKRNGRTNFSWSCTCPLRSLCRTKTTWSRSSEMHTLPNPNTYNIGPTMSACRPPNTRVPVCPLNHGWLTCRFIHTTITTGMCRVSCNPAQAA